MNLFQVVITLFIISYVYCKNKDEDWESFKKKNKKDYANMQEHDQRKTIWSKRKEFIDAHNALKNDFKLKENSFADLTDDEIRTNKLGLLQNNKRVKRQKPAKTTKTTTVKTKTTKLTTSTKPTTVITTTTTTTKTTTTTRTTSTTSTTTDTTSTITDTTSTTTDTTSTITDTTSTTTDTTSTITDTTSTTTDTTSTITDTTSTTTDTTSTITDTTSTTTDTTSTITDTTSTTTDTTSTITDTTSTTTDTTSTITDTTSTTTDTTSTTTFTISSITSTTTSTTTTTTTTITNGTFLDYSQMGYTNPVEDQGSCGSCWAFAATDAIEGQYFKKYRRLLSLAEQQLVDCANSKTYFNLGCNGGYVDTAFQYVIDKGGLMNATSYPYTALTGKTCKMNSALLNAKLTGFVKVTPNNETLLLETLISVGPLAIAIDASRSSFQFYSSGIYYDSACSSTSLNHALLLVGYGTENGKDFWLVKNQWNTDWGINGFIKIARNRNNHCGIATEPMYPIVA